jgi:hypothetical protein
MSQNLISLTLSDATLKAVDEAITQLEAQFAQLVDLSADERRALNKMGDKSEAFCRQALTVMAQNPQLLPASVDLAEAQRDLHALDVLRSRGARLRQLLGRLDDTETALGSDVMSASLEGYALLKVLGKGSGLEELRKGMSARFGRSTASAKNTAV